jgi:hypothetical protein
MTVETGKLPGTAGEGARQNDSLAGFIRAITALNTERERS